ncbi:MAG: hypothetical protein H6624_16695 [Bdellovibrionaceae bacterium]|nr:hypothetical protein [Bdellovibrionales bacterium]MCB9085985.1 hypothetical protein [Pseudobdellovibrionaceae bacterium]
MIGHLPALGESIMEVDEVRNRARNRLYPGGIDEEDLKIQSRLTSPTKKVHASAIQAEILKIKPHVEDEPDEE